jgi:hypothetical protein
VPDAERGVMIAHVEYWRGHLAAGRALVFSPVADPAGDWGMAVVRAEDESELREIEAADPAVTGGIGRYDLLPLPGAITTADE